MAKSEFHVSKNAAVKTPRIRQLRKSEVAVTNVNSEVAQYAINAADWDASRIEVIDESTVIVWNNQEQRRHITCQFLYMKFP